MALIEGIVFGLIAMLGLGLNNAISRVPVRAIGSTKSVFFRNFFISLMLFIVVLIFFSESNFSLDFVLIAFFISFIGYLPLFTFYKALKVADVGVVAPIGNSAVIFTVLFSVIFFQEVLTITQIFSLFLIVLGIILISVNFRNWKSSDLFKFSSGIPFALVSCFLWGLVFFLFKIPVTVLGPILTAFIIEFGIFIFSGIHLKISSESFALPEKRILKQLFLVGLFGAIGGVAYNIGIKFAEVSIVAALAFSAPLVATIYGKVVYKEQLRAVQYGAIALILAGIILISIF